MLPCSRTAKSVHRKVSLPLFLFDVWSVAKSRFWLDRGNSPGFGSGFTSQVTQHKPYLLVLPYVACSLTLPIEILWYRLTSMSLAHTNTLL